METSGNTNPTSQLLTVIPDDLKKLARLVVRGFYSREDILIIDMLVRHHCMREDDLSNLLKFDKKLVRAKISTLKKDRLVQEKQRMESRVDDPSKVEKMNCYFINYKIFVNIVKYKLDHMRKKLEMTERDAASRSSFKCTSCIKTFTDLEVNELINPMTGEMTCTFCGCQVEEDEAAGPQSDSRQALARFNDQMKVLYDKLLAVETIKLDPSVLEPEPVELGDEKGDRKSANGSKDPSVPGGNWSGEATRNMGLQAEETKIEIDFGDEKNKVKDVPKDVPIWITQSTIEGADKLQSVGSEDWQGFNNESESMQIGDNVKQDDDDEITRLLLQHEKKNSASFAAANSLNNPNDSDSDNRSDDSDLEDVVMKPIGNKNEPENMSSDDEMPTVKFGEEEIDVTDVNEEIINRMTAEEKEHYRQVYAQYWSHMYD